MSHVPVPALSDPSAPRAPAWFERPLDAVVRPLLVDARDVVFARNALAIAVQVIPLSVVLFLLPGWWALLGGVVYLPFLMVRWAGPYVLMLHAVRHRPLFRRRYRWMDRLVTVGLAPWFGIPPFGYHPHHILMHHVENNGADDLSATYGYRRDSPAAFAHYWARFGLFGHLHLSSFLARRGRWRALAAFVIGELACAVAVAGLLAVRPAATLVVFVGPFLLLRFFLMAGNWAQHAFVDPADPTNAYTNSTCLLNTRYNHRCYNDGYHVVHHRKPGLHWADMPKAFLDDLPAYAEHDSVVFHGVTNNQQIWWALMTGRYDFLADRLVDLGDRRRTRDEKIAFLQSRVRGTGEARRGLLELREAAG